jgi:hypothetical protein
MTLAKKVIVKLTSLQVLLAKENPSPNFCIEKSAKILV